MSADSDAHRGQEAGSRDQEALEYLNRAVTMALDQAIHVESILRVTSHAATLMDNGQAATYFDRHITGFPENEVPASRVVSGTIVWVGDKSLAPFTLYDVAGLRANKMLSHPLCQLAIQGSLTSIHAWANTGFYRPAPTDKTQGVVLPGLPNPFTYVHPIENYDSGAFIHCLEMIRQDAFSWASKWIAYLKYGHRITDIWTRHRAVVDQKIQEIGLKNHFSAIDRQLGSTNPQDWRSAMLACRSLLQDLADFLWKDERSTYPPLERKNGQGKLVPFAVTQDKYVNRLMAYMNEKSRDKAQTKLTSKQLSLLGDILYLDYQIENKGHANVSYDLAETTAIHTYLLISDIIRLTDMQPITCYAD